MDKLGPALIGLLGVLIGAGITWLQQRAAGRHRFVERQITELYAPLVSLRKLIRAKSELRLKISKASSAAWKDETERRPADDLEALYEDKYKPLIDYDNQQFEDELFPAYKNMLQTLTENLWLAEEMTRAHYQNLVEYVELWDRWLKKSIPGEILEQVDLREETLYPLYEDIEQHLEKLRSKLAAGKA